MVPPTTPAAFWKKVEVTDSCWLWTAATNMHGYGVYKATGDRQKRVHRLAYEQLVGPIPPGFNILHRCDVRRCLNPAHLFVGTQADNTRDAILKGRHPIRPESLRPPGAPKYVRKGYRRGDEHHSRTDPKTVRRGEASPQARLTEADVLTIREQYAAGVSQRALALKFSTHFGNIHAIIKRKSWVHVGGPSASDTRPTTYAKGERNSNARLTPESVRNLRRRFAMGETKTALAREYGVSFPTVAAVVEGRAWRHVA